METPRSDGSEQRTRRQMMDSLCASWLALVRHDKLSADRFRLSFHLANEVIEHFIDEMQIVKLCYGIKAELALPKTAGLMAGAILHFRPIVPLFEGGYQEFYYEPHANEWLAIVTGFSLCCAGVVADERHAVLVDLCGQASFSKWMRDFIFLLHHGPHTPEALAFIFQTLDASVFRTHAETSPR